MFNPPQKNTRITAVTRMRRRSCCYEWVFFAGVLKESQQWEVYAEGPAGCPHAESPQVPPASSGRKVYSTNSTEEFLESAQGSKETRLFQRFECTLQCTV